jgi:transcriptional regulator with XRE-family HTH domain
VTKAQRRAAICAELVRLIGEERKRLTLSKNKLAELTGLNQSTISRLENHPENPTMDSLLRVADALEINLANILAKAIRNIDTRKPSSA